jgi:hypothetical protein
MPLGLSLSVVNADLGGYFCRHLPGKFDDPLSAIQMLETTSGRRGVRLRSISWFERIQIGAA